MARKILLADDSVTAQNMGRKILSDAGYEVITVNNGSAALKKIAEQRPDLIVLDVYMPGYSGLEVCQRIKDTKETSRIPILLTVGKLEPFKPEEARKAHADAYIVKPFEASELLVALTKLEDKIVPQAEAYKPGRFAKALAAVERVQPEAKESFGDKDSGWKNRIKFPQPGSRPAEPEPEEATSKKGFREDETPAEPSRAFERPIPEGLPKDITPEEIEAITAAAAQFSEAGKARDLEDEAAPEAETPEQQASEPRDSEPVSAAVPNAGEAAEASGDSAHVSDVEIPETQSEEAPATFAGSADLPQAAEPSRQEAASPVAEEAASQVSGGGNEEDIPEPASTAADVPSPAAADTAASAFSMPAPTMPAEPDSQVAAAAPQSASPANGSGNSQIPAAPASGTSDVHGPRWIAEPVSLETHEADLTLEKEMHKTFAAFAAADSAKATFATMAAEASTPALPDRPWSASETATAEEHPTSSPAPLVSDEAVGEYLPEERTAPGEVEAEAVTPPSAECAADTNGRGSETASQAAWSSSSPHEPEAENEAEGDAEPASEEAAAKAAAWENWRHIRDSVVGSRADLGDAAAAALANSPEDKAATKPEAMAAAAGAGSNTAPGSEDDSSAIANIVDSVLADLKPRLMQEIAKKMKKDSKPE